MNSLSKDLFAVKLYELMEQYGSLQSRIRVCGGGDRQAVRREIERVEQEYREKQLLLREGVENSRSPAVAELAAVQLECLEKSEELLRDKLASYMNSETNSPQSSRVEATALYAEYAIDFGTQAMRYALLAALKTIDMQMELDEKAGGQTGETV